MKNPTGLRVLIVEDEVTIALMMADMLSEVGHHAVGIVGTVDAAVAMINSEAPFIDAATLDINLAGTRSNEVADALVAHGIPFVVTTGYTSKDLPDFDDRSILHKPFLVDQFKRAFRALEFGIAEPC